MLREHTRSIILPCNINPSYQLRDSITVIIHASWRLDFNLSLQSFESNIRGTRNLIELGHAIGRAPTIKFIFTSSIASALSWDQSLGPYPEEVVLDARYAVGSGYGESKYVAERVSALRIFLNLALIFAIGIGLSDFAYKWPKCHFSADWPNLRRTSQRCMGYHRLVPNPDQVKP